MPASTVSLQPWCILLLFAQAESHAAAMRKFPNRNADHLDRQVFNADDATATEGTNSTIRSKVNGHSMSICQCGTATLFRE